MRCLSIPFLSAISYQPIFISPTLLISKHWRLLTHETRSLIQISTLFVSDVGDSYRPIWIGWRLASLWLWLIFQRLCLCPPYRFMYNIFDTPSSRGSGFSISNYGSIILTVTYNVRVRAFTSWLARGVQSNSLSDYLGRWKIISAPTETGEMYATATSGKARNPMLYETATALEMMTLMVFVIVCQAFSFFSSSSTVMSTTLLLRPASFSSMADSIHAD